MSVIYPKEVNFRTGFWSLELIFMKHQEQKEDQGANKPRYSVPWSNEHMSNAGFEWIYFLFLKTLLLSICMGQLGNEIVY